MPGMASSVADNVLDAIFNSTAYSVSAVYIQLHVGDPGSAGTANVATETTRQQLSCAAASGGAITSSADLVWTDISGSEDATHWSAWDAASAGTFLGSGTITANAYTAGDTFTIPAGDFDVSIPTA